MRWPLRSAKPKGAELAAKVTLIGYEKKPANPKHDWQCWLSGWDYTLTPRGAWKWRTCRRCKKTEESLLGIFMRRSTEVMSEPRITEVELRDFEAAASRFASLTDEADAPAAHMAARLVAEVRRLRALIVLGMEPTLGGGRALASLEAEAKAIREEQDRG